MTLPPDPFEDTPEEQRGLEIVIDPKTGAVKQAGTIEGMGTWFDKLRGAAERDLFFFGRYIMGFTLLTDSLHKPVCRWLQRVPPTRKLLILPRDHLKTTIVGRALPLHLFIQPKTDNIYFPGCMDKVCNYQRSLMDVDPGCDAPHHRKDGKDVRILLGYEVADNAMAQLRTIASDIDGGNPLLRALWPQKWPDLPCKSTAEVWNAYKIIINRDENFPQPSIDTAGIGAATTGRHYDVHIFDDICAKKAAESDVIMYQTTEWLKVSRAMLDHPDKSLEFTIGTHWAVHDTYEWIKKEDPTVECIVRAMIEDGQIIFPEVFTAETIRLKRKTFGKMFPLLYMSCPTDPELVDFDMRMIRHFEMKGGKIVFSKDVRDIDLGKHYGKHASTIEQAEIHPGSVTDPNAEHEARDFGRDEYLSWRHGRR